MILPKSPIGLIRRNVEKNSKKPEKTFIVLLKKTNQCIIVTEYLDREQSATYTRPPLIFGSHLYWALWRVIESHYELQRVVFGAPPLIQVKDAQHPTSADLQAAHELARELWQQNLNQLLSSNRLHAALDSAHREIKHLGAVIELQRGEQEELKEQVRNGEAQLTELRILNGRLRDEIETARTLLAQENARTETASVMATRLITTTSAHVANVAEQAVTSAVTL